MNDSAASAGPASEQQNPPPDPGRTAPAMSGGGLIAVLAIFAVLRLALHLFAPPVDDEAYYWLWGQHPALAYYDHPGLNAWLLGLASVLGWNMFALRLFPLLTTLATLAIFAWWARRLAGPDWRGYLLAAAAIWLASPIMFSFAGLAFPDHLLIFLGFAAIHLFVLFFEVTRRPMGPAGRDPGCSTARWRRWAWRGWPNIRRC